MTDRDKDDEALAPHTWREIEEADADMGRHRDEEQRRLASVAAVMDCKRGGAE